ncbi:nucleoside phosphorylase [Halococcus qingdaonensis]|uniref:nucleoside phosphorylase n=1 Tax=Halococcus qingdaonensis TaxID=224402 RepID=UPI002116FFFA|nr:nucleoside phosphorylase [Halococcus qingdaonensis]
MPYPNSPGKHDRDALITPKASINYFDDDPDPVPESVVLCFHDGLFEHVVNAYEGTAFDGESGYALDATDGQVGVVRVPGIGAPVTALEMEELIVRGAERFLSLGHVGSLHSDVSLGDLVVVDRALRDEGTSHHYLEPAKYVTASSDLCERLERVLEAANEPYRVGPTWTTDAVYRETVPEVERYRNEGVLTVDMEAAAMFAVATYRGVEASALFTISDQLDPTGWEPRFAETQTHLERAFARAVEALTR